MKNKHKYSFTLLKNIHCKQSKSIHTIIIYFVKEYPLANKVNCIFLFYSCSKLFTLLIASIKLLPIFVILVGSK
jgi:hypothetical protein